MIKISEAVHQVILKDEIAFEAARNGILNLSAYAEKIKPQIEEYTMKDIKIGSIVVALSRMLPEINSTESLRPEVEIEDLRIKSPLYEITYEKTKSILEQLKELAIFSTEERDFFVMTQGLGEITIICSKDIRDDLLNKIQAKPKSTFDELVAMSVRFAEKYLPVPNVLHSLASRLATRRINVIEIVSTYTELTFIVQKKDMNVAVEAMN